jgi:hypothetical protein
MKCLDVAILRIGYVGLLRIMYQTFSNKPKATNIANFFT